MIINNCILYVFILIFISPLTGNAVENIQYRFSDEVKEMLLNNNNIITGQGHLTYEWSNVDSTSARALDAQKMSDSLGGVSTFIRYRYMNVFFAFEGPKIRCDRDYQNISPAGSFYRQIEKYAFNGEEVTSLNKKLDDEKVLEQPIGLMLNYNNDDDVRRYDPRYYGTTILDTSLQSILDGETSEKGNIVLEDLCFVGEKTKGKINCRVYRGYSADKNSKLTVWIAPERRNLPVYLEYVGKEIKRTVTNSFKKYDDNLFFPANIVKKVYLLDKASNEMILTNIINLSIHDDFSINGNVHDDIFKITFPKGTAVRDERTLETYRVE